MVTILLIADQDRLARLFDFVREYPQIGVRVSRSLRQGIQEIAQEPPSLLFIQNHLSGLSGEIIARHLVAELEGKRPRVVLFGEGERSTPAAGVIDACLDAGLGDEELTAAIITLISESAPEPEEGVRETEVTVEALRPDSGHGDAISPTPSPLADEPRLPRTDEAETAPAATPREASPAGEPPGEIPAPASPESPFDRKLQAVLDQAPSPMPLAEVEDTVAQGAAGGERAPFTPPPREELHRRGRAPAPKLKPYLTGAALLAAGALSFFLLRPAEKPKPAPHSAGKPAPVVASPVPVAKPTPEPVGTAPSTPVPPAARPRVEPAPTQAASPPPKAPAPPLPAPAGKGLASLPGFIPREGIDKGYGKGHPGWERYRGARTEFKVYREDSRIRAVQAIDRSGIGIPESFLRGALVQMTRTRDYAILEKQPQGKFHVERGAVATGASLVIYRTAPGGAIRAFVVYFQ